MTNELSSAKSLLLMDDDRLVLATLGEGLRQAGYRVTTSSSVEEAEELLSANDFDLAILDMRLPGQSGLDLARQLRAANSDVPFIFLTAYSDDDLVTQASEIGAMGYVVKPADPDRLVPAIEAALARARDARQLKETGRQLQTALDADRDVSIAIGVMMERRRVGRQESFELLRTQARTERRKLIDLAREVVLAAEKLNLVSQVPPVETKPPRRAEPPVRRERH
ncbi:MAG: response regulator [Sterolibacteriaceae bacterium MAG5]|nr:response regulator [Candidatus Nitricoxidireducens bremensis]